MTSLPELSVVPKTIFWASVHLHLNQINSQGLSHTNINYSVVQVALQSLVLAVAQHWVPELVWLKGPLIHYFSVLCLYRHKLLVL